MSKDIKKFLQESAIFLIMDIGFTTILYLGSSFLELETNPFKWSNDTRSLISVAWMLMSWLVFFIVFVVRDEVKADGKQGTD